MDAYCLNDTVCRYEGIWSRLKDRIFRNQLKDRILRKRQIGRIFLSEAFGFAKPRSLEKAENTDINTSAVRLLDCYGNAVLRLAYSYLHNRSDAEEILQETLIQYIQTNPTLEGSEHEKAWLLRVAANLSKNRIKYNKIRDTDELNDELVAGEREDLSFVWEAVKSLPEKQREVIHLFYYEGYSVSQMADLLGRNESTLRSDLKRGREKLKQILKEAYDFEG